MRAFQSSQGGVNFCWLLGKVCRAAPGFAQVCQNPDVLTIYAFKNLAFFYGPFSSVLQLDILPFENLGGNTTMASKGVGDHSSGITAYYC